MAEISAITSFVARATAPGVQHLHPSGFAGNPEIRSLKAETVHVASVIVVESIGDHQLQGAVVVQPVGKVVGEEFES